jgi:predicted dehydrogenase
MVPLKLGMVGGGQDAFIGAVHRIAARLDGEGEVIAGAFSSTPERALASGRALGIAPDRNYGSWQEMLEVESNRPAAERIDIVSIVTPNHVHYPVAKAFTEAGFHVICDKPMVLDSAEADSLIDSVRRNDTVFAVTYNYTGYPMVKEARHLAGSGQLGEIRKVLVEYNQGWLATQVEASGAKQAQWRTDPARSGIAGAMGDIGSHAENLAVTVTGLSVTHLCADLNTFVPGRQLDDDANLLLRFDNGAKGVLVASQVALGEENALTLRVYGSEGSLAWEQQDPNQLVFRRLDEPDRILRRGNPYLSAAAQAASRLPSGHPEAFLEAFANIYRNVIRTVAARKAGRQPGEFDLDFPTVFDGARGVHFIEKTVESAASDRKWTEVLWRRSGSGAAAG